MTTQIESRVNGLDLEALGQLVEEIKNDETKGFVRFKVASTWKGQARSEARVRSYFMNGQELPRCRRLARRAVLFAHPQHQPFIINFALDVEPFLQHRALGHRLGGKPEWFIGTVGSLDRSG